MISRENPNAIPIADDIADVLPVQDTKNDPVVNTDLQADKKERGCVILCIIGK